MQGLCLPQHSLSLSLSESGTPLCSQNTHSHLPPHYYIFFNQQPFHSQHSKTLLTLSLSLESMADTEGAGFWLPSEFLDDDFLVDGKNNATESDSGFCFPSEFPYDYGSKSDELLQV